MDMNKEKLYIGYIDNTLSGEESIELEGLIASEGTDAKQELFEMKEIADTARLGSMTVIEQERKIIDLITMAEKSDKAAKCKRIYLNTIGYAAIAIMAFIIGIYAVVATRSSQTKIMEVHACAGNKTNLTLPDGTKVVLKSASTLKYDINGFAEGVREVNLDGEAFFDVTKINGEKFVINTERQKVTVHGTSFNLQAYDGDKSNTLVLLDGNVSIDLFDKEGHILRSLNINQMEKCTWDLLSGQTKVEKIESNEAGLGWYDNIFYFRNSSICDIAERLEHYYGINIATFDLENDSERFSGALSLNQPVSEIMKTLNYDKNFILQKIDNQHFSIRKETTK